MQRFVHQTGQVRDVPKKTREMQKGIERTFWTGAQGGQMESVNVSTSLLGKTNGLEKLNLLYLVRLKRGQTI